MSLILECVTYVRERLLPMSKVYTWGRGTTDVEVLVAERKGVDEIRIMLTGYLSTLMRN